MSKKKTHALTILMLKEHITDGKAVIKYQSNCRCVDIDSEGCIGKLFYKQNLVNYPVWVKLFKPVLGDKLDKLYNSGTAAVLLVQSENRYFAITFGYGRSLLLPDSFEENFGLRIVLNTVNPEKIRSVDIQTLDAVPLSQRNQASVESPISDFGLDVERELIYAATGQPNNPDFGKRLTGKDALKISIPVTLKDISGLLIKLVRQYKSDLYKENFSWVDNLKEVRKKSDIEKLDAELAKKIQQSDFERTWLSIPEIIDWSDISGFKYQKPKQGNLLDDIDWESYLDFLGSEKLLTTETFRNHNVLAMSESSGQKKYNWTVYRCIYCELSVEGNDYALNNGKWYEINADYLNDLKEFIKNIPLSNLCLPDYAHANEANYNRSVHDENSKYFALLDAKSISHGGKHSKVEFCDLFTSDKHLVHVKRYAGSSVLSHLFAQGVVSARLLLSDSEFRKKINEKLPDSHKLINVDQRPKAEEFEVVYAIVTNSKKEAPELPLFSKITLRNSFNQLQQFGMKVSLKYVKTTKKRL